MKNGLVGKIVRWLVALAVLLVLLPWVAVAGEKSALDEQLIEAAGRGEVGTVKGLLDEGADASASNQYDR